MAVAFFGVGTQKNTTITATSVNVPVPAGTPQDAVMILAVSIPSTTVVITPPAGWTEIAIPVVNITTQAQLRLFERIAGASEPATYTVTFSGAVRYSTGISVYTGAVRDAFNSNTDETVDTSKDGPVVNPTSGGNWLYTVWAYRITGNANSGWTAQAGDSERYDIIGDSGTAAQISLMSADSGGTIPVAPTSRIATTPLNQISVQAAVLLSPSALPEGCALTPAGIAPQTTFGQPTISQPPPVGCGLTPAGIAPQTTFGQAVISQPGPVGCALEATGIDASAIMGQPAITQGLPVACALTPAGIAPQTTFGQPTISQPPPVGCAFTAEGIPPQTLIGKPTVTVQQPVKPCPKPGCIPWGLDPAECCPGWDELPIGLRTTAIELASDVLWALSGRRYRECWTTIRPCETFCLCCGSGAKPPNWWLQSGRNIPYLDNRGRLRSECGCECNSCCASLCAVYLNPGPVLEICSVKIDGAELAADRYQVLDNSILVMEEKDGCFPDCQNLALPDTEPGTWSITYRYGLPVPAGGRRAAQILACEIAKSCTGARGCRLPSRVQQLTRDGVTLQLDPMDFLDKGLVGVTEIDVWLRSVNPYGLAAPSQVWSPDTEPPRTVTWPR